MGGSTLVQPPEQRLVAASDDMAAHIRAALQLEFPQPEFSAPVARDLVAAVEQCFALGDALPEWRAARVAEAQEIAASLQEANEHMLKLATPHTRPLVQGMNLAFMAAFVDAVSWPDVAAVERFVRGFPIVGDIPDSGLFRPVDRPATVSLDEFTPAANHAWATELAGSLAHRAAAATGDDRAALEALEAVTAAEANNGYVIGPRSRRALDVLFGPGIWRAMRRFGIWQGEGDARKVRAIDNAKGNRLNGTMTTWETIYCMTLFFIVQVASLFAAAARRAGTAMPRMRIGLDDMRAAYRRIPVATPWFTVFAIWSFMRQRVVYYYLRGHNFGAVSAVLNFNRFPAVLVAMCRVLFAVPCNHFFDDYVIVDLHAGGTSGQEALAAAHELVGQEVEPKKRKHMADKHKTLGQMADVSQVHIDQTVVFSPEETRCTNVLRSLRAARARNHLPTGEAGRIRGKIGWVLSAAYARVGRAAAQPLTDREHSSGGDASWTPALEEMLNFFEVLFSVDADGRPRLPPLRVPIFRHPRRPVVIYSDAMFRRLRHDSDELWRDPRGVPFSRVAFVVFFPGRARPVVSRLVLPPWVYNFLSADAHTLIQQAELIAAVGAWRTLAANLQDEAVIHFEDNTGALSNLVHGYASRPDCGRIANAFHLTVAGLHAKSWLEWVPSKANVADLPSRDDDLALLDVLEAAGFADGFDEVDFNLPPFESWGAPLAAFAAL